jgi:hypothetical protein
MLTPSCCAQLELRGVTLTESEYARVLRIGQIGASRRPPRLWEIAFGPHRRDPSSRAAREAITSNTRSFTLTLTLTLPRERTPLLTLTPTRSKLGRIGASRRPPRLWEIAFDPHRRDPSSRAAREAITSNTRGDASQLHSRGRVSSFGCVRGVVEARADRRLPAAPAALGDRIRSASTGSELKSS